MKTTCFLMNSKVYLRGAPISNFVADVEGVLVDTFNGAIHIKFELITMEME